MRELTDPNKEVIRNFQRHLSSLINFEHDNQLVDIFPRYNSFKSKDLNFICHANSNSLNILCNRAIMEHICNYFNISFEPIVNIITQVAKCLDEYKLITYESYERSLIAFPNTDEMSIPVTITPLNLLDIKKNFFQKLDFKMLNKIFLYVSLDLHDTPKLIINIDFLLYFKNVVRLEITKPLDGEQVFRVSTISSLSSIGRARKNYKTVTEDQMLRQLKRYAFRRLRRLLMKCLKIDNVLLSEQDDLNRYIALAEMSLI